MDTLANSHFSESVGKQQIGASPTQNSLGAILARIREQITESTQRSGSKNLDFRDEIPEEDYRSPLYQLCPYLPNYLA